MKKIIISAILVFVAALMVWGYSAIAAPDKYLLKAPNGISFSEIKGYETWQTVAVSRRTDNKELRVILANPTMIKAYKKGIPGKDKLFPDKSIIVKIAWSERQNAYFPAAYEPDVLRRVEFIIKDSKRFPKTSGWGYARFVYDAKTSTFTPYGKDASFVQECYECHTTVKQKDFIFTSYPQR
jgi:hypothetical protein